MYHDAALATQAKADPRPKSAVSTGCGLAGLAGMACWLVFARMQGLDGPYAALVNLLAGGLPMVLWAVLVDKVHRNPTTGVNWGTPRPLRETLDISINTVKSRLKQVFAQLSVDNRTELATVIRRLAPVREVPLGITRMEGITVTRVEHPIGYSAARFRSATS